MMVEKQKEYRVTKSTNNIKVIGARENNLDNVSLEIPGNKLTVVTGISGSGKSSLAFDTIYAEGQRRYMETFSAYARQFIGDLERPDVEEITGLSPVISIEQKTTGWNPRSTVGTTTEIYDFLRLLYARIGDAFSYATGKRMIQFSEDELVEKIYENFNGHKITILANLVRGRKGHYRELFDQMRKQGYQKMRVDGEIIDLEPNYKVDRYKIHDIDLIIDRIKVDEKKIKRLGQSIQLALRHGNDVISIYDHDQEKDFLFSTLLIDPETGISYEAPSPNSFSFNSPYGACPTCKGMGEINGVSLEKVIPDMTKSIHEEGISPFGKVRDNSVFRQLRQLAKKYNFSFSSAIEDLPRKALDVILYGADPAWAAKYGVDDYSYDLEEVGLINYLQQIFENTESPKLRRWAEDYMEKKVCSECHGYRLKKESLHYKIAGKHIGELAQMDLDKLHQWLDEVWDTLNEQQKNIGREILREVKERLGFMLEVGLDYLTLDRPARSLSGGESQRTRLATQIGSQLTGITYILDEPSIGLHQRDNDKLTQSLRDLVNLGNTVIVVEHDKDFMKSADYLIDLGPGAGDKGGKIVAQGTPDEIMESDSITGEFLAGKRQIKIPEKTREGSGEFIRLKGAHGHNLKNVDLEIPLATLVCVTGVSGSGKSSLINETLYPIVRQKLYNSFQNPLPFESIEGLEHIDKVIEVDQSPIGRTPRSNPVTYTGIFTEIRKLFAEVPEAKIRGYQIGRFSFNVKGGRCEVCQGAGKREIEMNFLPDVYVNCERCQGRRYNRETLEIIYKGKNIYDVLSMTVDEAVEFYKSVPKIYRKLKLLQDVGLGYIRLGQQAPTLSGGEAQRVKLADELGKRSTGQTLYILDEPSTGLHFQDIEHLLEVINKLVDKGNTVIIIEHNLDIIKTADHIIDLGKEGGRNGGEILFAGRPRDLIKLKDENYTAHYLAMEFMNDK